MKNAKEEKVERSFHEKRRQVMKKQMKPILYDGVEYESQSAFARAMRFSNPSYVYALLRDGEYKGKPLIRKKL